MSRPPFGAALGPEARSRPSLAPAEATPVQYSGFPTRRSRRSQKLPTRPIFGSKDCRRAEARTPCPRQLNIACYHYRAENSDRFIAELAIVIQESGIADPPTTNINGVLAIRVIARHLTVQPGVDARRSVMELEVLYSQQPRSSFGKVGPNVST